MAIGYNINTSTINQQSNLKNRDNHLWYQTEVVSFESTGGCDNPSLIISSDETIHIFWSDVTLNYSGSGNDEDIFYKFKPKGGDWSNAEVVSTESNRKSFSPSLVLDSEGIIHIVWYDISDLSGGSDYNPKLFYKYKSLDGNWSETEIISSEADNDMWDSDRTYIMIDDYDTLHVIWLDDYWYQSKCDIAYSYKIKNGNWSPKERATFDSTNVSFWASAVVEPDGTVHVAWNEEYAFTQAMLHYKNRTTDGVWSEAEEMQPMGPRRHSRLAVENDGTLHIVYGEGAGAIFYNCKPKGGSWGNRKYISYPNRRFSTDPVIAVDDFGNVHVAWEEFYPYHGNNAVYRYKRVNGEWTTFWEIVNSETGGRIWDVAIDTDNEGIIHFAWRDDANYQGSGSDVDVLYRSRIFPESDPPEKPIIDGPINGKVGTEYIYRAVTNDSEGDNVSYFFDWGDGTNSGWTQYVPSGESVARSHYWSIKGTYTIKVKAKDDNGVESDWSELKVNMPRNRATYNSLLLRFLEQFPILTRLLSLLK
jgi:hypothetical protein